MKKNRTFEQLLDQFEAVKSRIEEFHNVPEDLFIQKPTADTWSAAEVCNHLVQFNTLYLTEIEKAAANPVVSNEEIISLRAGFLCRQFIKFLEPPYKVRFKTVEPMQPVYSERTAGEIISKLLHTENELTGWILYFQKQQIDLNRTKGKNPVIKWLPMSIADLLLVLDAHQRRHIWQIENTLSSLSGTKH